MSVTYVEKSVHFFSHHGFLLFAHSQTCFHAAHGRLQVLELSDREDGVEDEDEDEDEGENGVEDEGEDEKRIG